MGDVEKIIKDFVKATLLECCKKGFHTGVRKTSDIQYQCEYCKTKFVCLKELEKHERSGD